jgi:type IV pilus secretin PilQ/predicted competence protein
MRGKLAMVALAIAALVVVAAGQPVVGDTHGGIALSAIRPELTNKATRLTIEATGPLSYTYYSPDPLTLVIDVPDVDATQVPAKISVGSPEVESVRVTSLARADGRTLARVEIRLASLAPYHIVAKDSRLSVEFERAGGSEAAGVAVAAPAAQAVTRTAAATPAPKVAASAAPVAPEPAAANNVPLAVAPPEPDDLPAAAAAPRPVSRSAGPATTLTGVSHDEENGQVAVTVSANGSIQYEDFTLPNPDRLVLDVSGVTVQRRTINVGDDPVQRVRVAQFSAGAPKVARIVVDLTRRATYRIVEASDGVKILFDTGHSEPLAAMEPPSQGVDSAPPVLTPVAQASAAPTLPVLAPVPALAAADTSGQTSAFEAKTLREGEPKYTGHPISMDFKDGDLQDIFRLFADISGLNVVVNPGVSGKVTLKLTEVPWDQALDLILKTNGLGYTVEDNVLRIARLSDLQKEETDKRKLQEEKELAGQLEEMLRPVSYAKAKDLADVVKKAGAISRRGSIHIDDRTNTIIMQDLPRFLDRAKALMNELDRPTRQVEIEARVVVTTRNFTRDLGVQWGFLNQRIPEFGNTLKREYPNTLTVGGALTGDNKIQPDVGPYMINLPAASATSGIGVATGNILGNFNLDAALGALEREGRGRILSTPKITTQDNQKAEIKQGLQFPIQITQNNTVTVQYRDAALTLTVTPQITEAGTVILNLQLQNNSPDFGNQVNGFPSIQIQEASTVLLVHDGQTAVVGGVYKTTESTTRDSTPGLSRIPLLGYLFRRKSQSRDNQELLLFITPHIVAS